MPDIKLKQWATERQSEIIDAVIKHGSNRKAAIALNVSGSYIDRTIISLRTRAARDGYAPGHFSSGVAPGYRMGKVTIQRGVDGVERVWERQHPNEGTRLRDIEEMVRNAASDAQGMSVLRPGPEEPEKNLLASYWFGDPHFGLGSSSEDGGDDASIDDTDRITRSAIDNMVLRTPKTERAILGFIGDNLHANDSSALTPENKNPLDVDVRGFGAAFLSCTRAICYAASRALEKHSYVDVWILPGNHDPDAAFAISVAVSMFFDNNPRVNIRLSRESLWWTVFGKNLIAAHHGDKIKPIDMHGVLSNDCQEVWATCVYRYVFRGHIHHDTVIEYQKTRIESLRTLSKSDSWHRGQGYRSVRDTRVIIYHKDFGETSRYTVSAAMLDRA